MTPSRVIYDQIANLLAADTTTLAAITAMHVHPVVSPFTPNLDLDLASLTMASFTGGGAKNVDTGAQQVFYDAVSGLLTIDFKEPLGGWHWLCTADPATPETVYGIAVTDNADAVLYGCFLLDPAPVISEAGQGFDVNVIQFRFVETSPS